MLRGRGSRRRRWAPVKRCPIFRAAGAPRAREQDLLEGLHQGLHEDKKTVAKKLVFEGGWWLLVRVLCGVSTSLVDLKEETMAGTSSR